MLEMALEWISSKRIWLVKPYIIVPQQSVLSTY